MIESLHPERSFGAFLFDMDGTILSSIEATERVWSRWALRYELDLATFLPTIHGVRASETIARQNLPGVDPQTEAELVLRDEMEDVEGRLSYLASVGSSAPFIGLFGTVVGIMTSFQAIAGSESTNLAVVAPGIAEALLATALGLVAAIPAVIGYNKLTADAAKLAGRMEAFADEFSAILSRQIDERSQGQRAQAAQ